MIKTPISLLIEKFKAGTCSAEEEALIRLWLHELNQDGNHGLTEEELLLASESMRANLPIRKKRHSVNFILRYAAAAMIAIPLLWMGIQYYNTSKNKTTLGVASSIKPGGNRATLTLANGKRIVLTEASIGTLSQQSGINISKTAEGLLVCTVTASSEESADFSTALNEIATPKGGQYQINLPDGTKVWLNAASSLKFPTVFAKNQRRVELTGEAYFEVNPEKRRGSKIPFIVNTSSQSVEVLGTHFNISSYTDDALVKTTLLEGAVAVHLGVFPGTKKPTGVRLVPGQQAVLKGADIKVRQVDVESEVAWKNGTFRFDDENMEEVMRKISRWYNVDVMFESEDIKQKQLAGVITKFANVSELLKMMELTGEFKFEIKQRTIKVSKQNNQ